jgi:hypothetical protein
LELHDEDHRNKNIRANEDYKTELFPQDHQRDFALDVKLSKVQFDCQKITYAPIETSRCFNSRKLIKQLAESRILKEIFVKIFAPNVEKGMRSAKHSVNVGRRNHLMNYRSRSASFLIIFFFI